MHNLLQRNLASGFSDFPGLSLSGTIPIREELINDLLQDFLRKNAEAGGTADAQSGQSNVNLSNLLRLVRKAAIHADAGVVTLELELRA